LILFIIYNHYINILAITQKNWVISNFTLVKNYPHRFVIGRDDDLSRLKSY